MEETELFSVLIANYNNGRYLQEAIDSVLAQTYGRWEVVIVDDGSTDNSAEIYGKYQDDSRFHISFNAGNKGCGYTKRRCAELAHGELCGFLDADDALLSDALEAHVEAHRRHPEVSCVFSRYYYCDGRLNVTGESRRLTLAEGQGYFTGRDYLPEHLASFKRACYLRTEGIDASLPAAVDQDLYFKLEETAPVYVMDKFTYKYRIGDGQISQGGNWAKTFYWNLVVRHNTCLRRHLAPGDYPGQDLCERVQAMETEREAYKRELARTRSSRAFRLGKALLAPWGWLKKNR